MVGFGRCSVPDPDQHVAVFIDRQLLPGDEFELQVGQRVLIQSKLALERTIRIRPLRWSKALAFSTTSENFICLSLREGLVSRYVCLTDTNTARIRAPVRALSPRGQVSSCM